MKGKSERGGERGRRARAGKGESKKNKKREKEKEALAKVEEIDTRWKKYKKNRQTRK